MVPQGPARGRNNRRMSLSTAFPGLHTPGAGFDQPFEMLAACHDRVRRSLQLLQRLVEHLQTSGADAMAQDAARDVLRYFTMAAPAHHEDEERHVIPLLLAAAEPRARAAAERMLDDHAEIRSAWQALDPLLQQVAGGTLPAMADLQAAAERFGDVHREHLRLEDEFAFPEAQGRLGADAQAVAAMGEEMASRRRR